MVFESVPYGIPSYVFSPKWFYGFDSIIELIAIIVSVLLVAKNRYGRGGDIPIEIDYRTHRIRQALPDEEELWP